ncbi:MAG TPA: ergothioneine biosynthesis protein EgtB [Actinomycetota bacterium]|nr:ergothioneine biosynthesis protein EgtB [Actinomycetota bacterium]
MDLKQVVAEELEAARRRSLELLDPLSEEVQMRQHSRLMSPLVWDLAHIGNFEELWLLREVAGLPPTSPKFDDMYNAFEHPRWKRPELPLLKPREARAYLADVRGRALDVLERIELDPSDRLLGGGFVYTMVVQHEHQHDETMLSTLQLMSGDPLRPPRPPAPEGSAVQSPEVSVQGGPFVMGTDSDPLAYDNERPAHVVDLPPFRIDATPVCNADYAQFIAAGGYDDQRWWHPEGWAWRRDKDIRHPAFWSEGTGSWSVRRFGRHLDLDPREPVQHVSWYEADAYARWAGKRLPTEAEWEKAASWEPSGRKRRYPWGDSAPTAALANLGERHYGPAPVGAYAPGASPWGCRQMVGDVWEWTSSDFRPYPGFRSFPYEEYSEAFFGPDYKVLRGGSWATHPSAIRTTFRNWDYPVRRQIFAGFRCARDA